MTDSKIPGHVRAQCELCGREVNTGVDGVYRWTAGWMMNRSGGGGHSLSLKQSENKWAHGKCVEDKVRGYQGSMF